MKENLVFPFSISPIRAIHASACCWLRILALTPNSYFKSHPLHLGSHRHRWQLFDNFGEIFPVNHAGIEEVVTDLPAGVKDGNPACKIIASVFHKEPLGQKRKESLGKVLVSLQPQERLIR